VGEKMKKTLKAVLIGIGLFVITCIFNINAFALAPWEFEATNPKYKAAIAMALTKELRDNPDFIASVVGSSLTVDNLSFEADVDKTRLESEMTSPFVTINVYKKGTSDIVGSFTLVSGSRREYVDKLHSELKGTGKVVHDSGDTARPSIGWGALYYFTVSEASKSVQGTVLQEAQEKVQPKVTSSRENIFFVNRALEQLEKQRLDSLLDDERAKNIKTAENILQQLQTASVLVLKESMVIGQITEGLGDAYLKNRLEMLYKQKALLSRKLEGKVGEVQAEVLNSVEKLIANIEVVYKGEAIIIEAEGIVDVRADVQQELDIVFNLAQEASLEEEQKVVEEKTKDKKTELFKGIKAKELSATEKQLIKETKEKREAAQKEFISISNAWKQGRVDGLEANLVKFRRLQKSLEQMKIRGLTVEDMRSVERKLIETDETYANKALNSLLTAYDLEMKEISEHITSLEAMKKYTDEQQTDEQIDFEAVLNSQKEIFDCNVILIQSAIEVLEQEKQLHPKKQTLLDKKISMLEKKKQKYKDEAAKAALVRYTPGSIAKDDMPRQVEKYLIVNIAELNISKLGKKLRIKYAENNEKRKPKGKEQWATIKSGNIGVAGSKIGASVIIEAYSSKSSRNPDLVDGVVNGRKTTVKLPSGREVTTYRSGTMGMPSKDIQEFKVISSKLSGWNKLGQKSIKERVRNQKAFEELLKVLPDTVYETKKASAEDPFPVPKAKNPTSKILELLSDPAELYKFLEKQANINPKAEKEKAIINFLVLLRSVSRELIVLEQYAKDQEVKGVLGSDLRFCFQDFVTPLVKPQEDKMAKMQKLVAEQVLSGIQVEFDVAEGKKQSLNLDVAYTLWPVTFRSIELKALTAIGLIDFNKSTKQGIDKIRRWAGQDISATYQLISAIDVSIKSAKTSSEIKDLQAKKIELIRKAEKLAQVMQAIDMAWKEGEYLEDSGFVAIPRLLTQALDLLQSGDNVNCKSGTDRTNFAWSEKMAQMIESDVKESKNPVISSEQQKIYEENPKAVELKILDTYLRAITDVGQIEDSIKLKLRNLGINTQRPVEARQAVEQKIEDLKLKLESSDSVPREGNKLSYARQELIRNIAYMGRKVQMQNLALHGTKGRGGSIWVQARFGKRWGPDSKGLSGQLPKFAGRLKQRDQKKLVKKYLERPEVLEKVKQIKAGKFDALMSQVLVETKSVLLESETTEVVLTEEELKLQEPEVIEPRSEIVSMPMAVMAHFGTETSIGEGVGLSGEGSDTGELRAYVTSRFVGFMDLQTGQSFMDSIFEDTRFQELLNRTGLTEQDIHVTKGRTRYKDGKVFINEGLLEVLKQNPELLEGFKNQLFEEFMFHESIHNLVAKGDLANINRMIDSMAERAGRDVSDERIQNIKAQVKKAMEIKAKAKGKMVSYMDEAITMFITHNNYWLNVGGNETGVGKAMKDFKDKAFDDGIFGKQKDGSNRTILGNLREIENAENLSLDTFLFISVCGLDRKIIDNVVKQLEKLPIEDGEDSLAYIMLSAQIKSEVLKAYIDAGLVRKDSMRGMAVGLGTLIGDVIPDAADISERKAHADYLTEAFARAMLKTKGGRYKDVFVPQIFTGFEHLNSEFEGKKVDGVVVVKAYRDTLEEQMKSYLNIQERLGQELDLDPKTFLSYILVDKKGKVYSKVSEAVKKIRQLSYSLDELDSGQSMGGSFNYGVLLRGEAEKKKADSDALNAVRSLEWSA
jgi:hypothetical protein